MTINPDSLKNIEPHKFKSKWNNGKTRTIRVPVTLADQVLDYAHQLDDGKGKDSSVLDKLTEIMQKVDNKEKGYKSNGSGQLIKELRELLKDS